MGHAGVAGKLQIREYGLAMSDVVLKKTYDVVATKLFGAFGAVVDAKGRMVLTMPGDRQLAVRCSRSTANGSSAAWADRPEMPHVPWLRNHSARRYVRV